MPRDCKNRILVVDDEDYICRIIVESLGDAGYEITAFTDPSLALEFLAASPVDLVLTDLMLGEYSGLQVLEAAKESHPDAIVVLMTAHPTVQTAISVLKKGAYDFLVKPFKLELLNQTVRRGLAHQKVLRENVSLKGQVEFLKVANAFSVSPTKLDSYLQMILRSCNTELQAKASSFIEVDPATGEVVGEIDVSRDEASAAILKDPALVKQHRNGKGAVPIIDPRPAEIEGRKLTRFVISQPVMVRRKLHGVINILTVSRLDDIPPGQLDILSMLAGSAASAIANQKLYDNLQQSYFQAIRALTNSIEARDLYTAGHTDRVTRLAEQMALYLGWDEGQLFHLRVGCTLHDIGKIGVPDAILNKTGRLTNVERKKMENHPRLGLKIVQGISVFKPAVPYITAHHERYDGTGYPKGLMGREIPIEGRLLAVVDTFDAILSDRPYREGASVDVAVSELLDNAGSQFDPDLVDAFLKILKAGVIDIEDLYGRKEDLSCLDGIGVSETEPA